MFVRFDKVNNMRIKRELLLLPHQNVHYSYIMYVM